MSSGVNLDEVGKTLSDEGCLPEPAIVVEMYKELVAWRAAHYGGGVVVTGMQNQQPQLVIAAIETYRSCVEGVMKKLGFPQDDD